MHPLLHVVTYMTRIDYKALLTPLFAKACVVQWIGSRTPDSGADGSNHGVGRYFFYLWRSLPNIFRLLFIFSLGFLYELFYLVRKMHAYPSLIYYLVHIQSDCIMISLGLI